jgi:Na+/phosphate symporter
MAVMALKEIVSETHDLFSDMIDGLDRLHEGFIYNNLKSVEEARPEFAAARERGPRLTEALLRERDDNPNAVIYVSVPSHLERSAAELERIAASLDAKIREDLLFSDKAQSEVNFMFEKIKDILSNTRDMLLARNTIIGNYIMESEHALTMSANDFSTQHEERLIEGVCLPKASAVYLELLGAFKAIAWHSKEIASALLR